MIYWSIDIDFWYGSRKFDFSTSFFDDVLRLGVPVHVVESHEELLPHIRQFDFSTLVNTDFHSDLCTGEDGDPGMDEGTWGYYVPKKKKRKFVWHYPSKRCLTTDTGYCHGDTHPNPFIEPQYSGWWQTDKRLACEPDPKSRIVAVGISILVRSSQYPQFPVLGR